MDTELSRIEIALLPLDLVACRQEEDEIKCDLQPTVLKQVIVKRNGQNYDLEALSQENIYDAGEQAEQIIDDLAEIDLSGIKFERDNNLIKHTDRITVEDVPIDQIGGHIIRANLEVLERRQLISEFISEAK